MIPKKRIQAYLLKGMQQTIDEIEGALKKKRIQMEEVLIDKDSLEDYGNNSDNVILAVMIGRLMNKIKNKSEDYARKWFKLFLARVRFAIQDNMKNTEMKFIVREKKGV